MKFFHGCHDEDTIKQILKNGLRMNDGHYGVALYASRNFDLALTYTEDEQCNTHKELVLSFEIDDGDVLKLEYDQAARMCGRECNENVKFCIAKELKELQTYAFQNNIKFVEILYEDGMSELVVYDVGNLHVQCI